MKTKVCCINDIKVVGGKGEIRLVQGDNEITTGPGEELQELIDGLLTVNFAVRRAQETEKRKQLIKREEG